MDLGSFLDLGSWILDLLGSWIVDLGSWISDRGSLRAGILDLSGLGSLGSLISGTEIRKRFKILDPKSKYTKDPRNIYYK